MEFTSHSRIRHCDVKTEIPNMYTSEDISCENSQLRALLMNGREINELKIKTEENNVTNSLNEVDKMETNTLVFDKDLYYKEIKPEANENCSIKNVIKNDECSNNFDSMNCNISYADFQLTNEEIVVKQECSTGEG